MLLKTPLLSLISKLRLLWEPFVQSKSPQNESLADFVQRRLGSGVVDGLLTPMVAGIYAAHPSELDVRACFPKLVEWENTYGSLFVRCSPLLDQREKHLYYILFEMAQGRFAIVLQQRWTLQKSIFSEATKVNFFSWRSLDGSQR